jgi:hypothetical protein
MNQLKLFMYPAECSAASLNYRYKEAFSFKNTAVGEMLADIGYFILGLVKFIIICGIVVGLFYGSCKAINYVSTDNYRINKTASLVTTTPVPNSSSVDKQIKDTLHAVAKEWKRQKDYSGDGLVNCQDAAILFYKYYPDKENCGIESNSQMVHAFNVVKINGVWRAIEPQAYTDGDRPASYFMRDYWAASMMLSTTMTVGINTDSIQSRR